MSNMMATARMYVYFLTIGKMQINLMEQMKLLCEIEMEWLFERGLNHTGFHPPHSHTLFYDLAKKTAAVERLRTLQPHLDIAQSIFTL